MESFFASQPHLRFITIKGCKSAHQKISYWSDRLRKVCSSYFIVREKNKIKDGYHFHCIVSLKEPDLKKGWFVKGVHIHVKSVGDVNPCTIKPSYPECAEEEELLLYGDASLTLEERLVIKSMARVATADNAKRSKNKKICHVQSVLAYMNKDITLMSSQFTDYIYCKHGKQVAYVQPIP